MQNRQLALFDKGRLGSPPVLEHGGDVRLGQRKIARPLDTKRPLHIVLRSSRAKRAWSMLRPELAARIRRKAGSLARRYDVRLYRYANVGNHIHVLATVRSRLALQSFLRVFAGATARLVTGARKGRPVGRFWDRLAYSRIVLWGREFSSVSAYVRQNQDEALGLRPYVERTRRRFAHSPAASGAMSGHRSSIGPP
jgi:REP element-mobilizing transposase RayT